MSGYLRLDRPPEWVLHYPACSACDVDLDTDGDGWTCPSCGTYWDTSAGDGDLGTLYEEWSGETLDGEPLTHDEAERVAIRREAEKRQEWRKRRGISR